MQKIEKALNQDFIGICIQKWQGIPSLYKKAFLIIFAGINIAFAFHTINFITGNHDWDGLVHGTAFYTNRSFAFYEGRYFRYVLETVFLTSNMLPILSNLISFAEYSLAAVLLCFYWRMTKSLLFYSLTGMLLVVQPFTLTWLYFFNSMVGAFGSILFAIAACIIGYKASEIAVGIKRYTYALTSVFLFVLCLGTYGPLLNTIAVVFFGRIFIDFSKSDMSKKSIFNILKSHIYTCAAFLIAFFIHGCVILMLKHKGILSNHYNVETLPLSELPARFIDIVTTVFGSLKCYQRPFFTSLMTTGFTVLLLVMIIGIILQIIASSIGRHKKVIKIFILMGVLTLTLIFTMTASFITKIDNFQQARVDIYGLAIFRILAIVVLFSMQKNFLKNICALGCIILLQNCFIQDALALKVWKFGFESEKMMWNRIINRVEETPGFVKGHMYDLLFVGSSLPAMRQNYLPNSEYHLYDLLDYAYDPHGCPLKAVEFYGYRFIDIERRYATTHRSNKELQSMVFDMATEIEKAKIWPDKSSIAIKNDTLLVVMDQTELDKLKIFIKENRK